MINGKKQVRAVILAVFFFIPVFLPCPAKGASSPLQEIKRLAGPMDAALLADPSGRVIVSVNASERLIPASTLKLLTALTAFHYLGEDYRFKTEFYVRDDGSLVIKGFGDPLLVSEDVQSIAAFLRKHMDFVHHIILDDTYFAKPLIIPGTERDSIQPYDAPCGALSVNFNSFGFRLQEDGSPVSAEPQTPFVDIAREKIISLTSTAALCSGRIPLSCENNEVPRYAGQVFAFFLAESGIRVTGEIRAGKADPGRDMLVYRHVSSLNLTEIITRLMKSSNNFIANQVFLAAGAKAYGPPATLEKGIRAVKQVAADELKIKGISMVEGSGISRENRLSADNFLKILKAFQLHYHLLRHQDGEYFKTGTLNGIHTRVGYLEGADGRLYPFVALINTPGEKTDSIMKNFKRLIR